MKEKGFTLKKKKQASSKIYPAETLPDADNAYDLALLANTPAKAESLIHRLEQVAGDISLHVN